MLHKPIAELFMQFRADCAAIAVADLARVCTIAQETVQHLKHSKKQRPLSAMSQALQQHWYQSLAHNAPDYSVYATEDYLAELWACFEHYSRKYIRDMQNAKLYPEPLTDVRTIVDLGCGLGYTTAMLAELYPGATVYATNLLETPQARIAKRYAEQYAFTVCEDLRELPTQSDLVFASEYFEHFERPIEHLYAVLSQTQPRYVLCANAFTADSIGHFPRYIVESHVQEREKTARAFNHALRKAQYTRVTTHCWNDRPQLWRQRPAA